MKSIPVQNHERVFQALQAAKTPMSAYELLDAVRPHGISAPPTVYRALERLVEEGRAHKLESAKAYVACCDPSHGHGTAVFAICRDCGGIEELIEPAIVADLRRHGARRGFAVDAASIELKGHCAACQTARPA